MIIVFKQRYSVIMPRVNTLIMLSLCVELPVIHGGGNVKRYELNDTGIQCNTSECSQRNKKGEKARKCVGMIEI